MDDNFCGENLLDFTEAPHSETLKLTAQNCAAKSFNDLLLDELRCAIKEYTGSLSALAHKSGVDPKTIRKISNSGHKRMPNADTVQRLLGVISKQRSVVGIANYYDGAIKTFFEKAFPQYFLKDASFCPSSDEVTNKITDIYSFMTVKLLSCYGEAGINRYEFHSTLTKFILRSEEELFGDEITDEQITMFGPIASIKIQQFLKINLIIENRNTDSYSLNYDYKQVLNIPFQLVQKFEGSMFKFCEPEFWAELDYFTRYSFNSCSSQESKLIAKIMFEAHKKCSEILLNSNSTDIPVNLLTSFETMNYHSNAKHKRGVKQ